MENQFKGSCTPWKVQHSANNPAFNVVGTRLGGKHKIARCPYLVIDDNAQITEQNKADAKADATLCAASPDLLEVLQESYQFLADSTEELAALSAAFGEAEPKLVKTVALQNKVRAAIAKALGQTI